MDLRIDGKRALVTGASSGLGEHFAKVLAEAGASVTLAARRLDKVEANAAALREAGHDAEAAEMDVADADSVAALFAGRAPFDILINNAGVAGAGAALAMTAEEFAGVIDTNLTGAFAVARAAAAGMRGWWTAAPSSTSPRSWACACPAILPPMPPPRRG